MTGFFERFSAAAATGLEFHFLRYRDVWLFVLACVLAFSIGYHFTVAAPNPFPSGEAFVIAPGASAREVADEFAAAHLVRSGILFRLMLRATGASAHIRPGAYRFESPENAFTVASRVGSGAFGIPPTRITFLEGDTVRDMAARVSRVLPEISASDFIAAAGPYEGYLFPDTYFFPPDATADSIVAVMRANFQAKVAPLAPDITASGHSLSDIIIMASLLEKEARSTDARQMIAGILWNRIERDMPLQVDAVFGYIFGRDTYSPSFEDLGVDSPYNTYTHTGLPPGPIDNPGLNSIEAALHPAQTNYLFYLTGSDGQMHYAKTYAGQLANQRQYLK